MNNCNLTIVFLGSSGFPYGFAEIARLKLLSKAIILAGHKVIVINPKGIHPENSDIEIASSGIYDEIRYIYATNTTYRPTNFVYRNFLKIKGILNEIRILINIKKSDKIALGILSTMDFWRVCFYVGLSKILSFKTVLSYVEFGSSVMIKPRTKLNDYLFDRYAFRLTDAVIPISDFLQKHVIKNSPLKINLKIPAICDFELFTVNANHNPNDKYFLYCGTAGYLKVIDVILKAFDLIDNESFHLFLIINGSKTGMELVKEAISNSRKRHLINLLSSLNYDELVNYYLNAQALLIPLRNTIQDEARFPHKVGEYTATGKPIITTEMGEMLSYFKDLESALIAKRFDSQLIAEKMMYVIQNPDEAAVIGRKGQRIGMKYFNYVNYSDKLNDFFKEVIHS